MITEIKKDGCIFSVDTDKTSQYYTTHSLCTCEGCQNFYKQIKEMFPKLAKFLDEFGVDISKPDEIIWYDIDNHIEYTPYYTVTGKIEKMGEYEINFGNLNLVFHKGDNQAFYIPNEQTKPYFIIEILNISLPWVLDAPFPPA